MLADLEGGLGNLAECFELQERARGHAQRFGHASHIRWLRAERVAECYWTGLWDEALSLADEIAGENAGDVATRHFMEGYCRDMRGRIRLARADLEGALEDASEALNQARGSDEPQMLYPALALCPRSGGSGRSRRSRSPGGRAAGGVEVEAESVPASSWVVDLACALEILGREVELADAAAGSSQIGVARRCNRPHGEFEVASELFAAIGSRPDEALARLRAAETRRRDRQRRECDRARSGAFLLPRRRRERLPRPCRRCSLPAVHACNQPCKVVDSATSEKGEPCPSAGRIG